MSEDVVKNGETCDGWLLYEGNEESRSFAIDDGRKLAAGKNIGIKRIRTLDRPRPAEKLRLNVYGDSAQARRSSSRLAAKEISTRHPRRILR